MTALRSIARSLPVVGIAAAAVLFAPTASADPDDQAFLDALGSKGITYPTQQYAIDTGHQVCDLVSGGQAPTDVAAEISSNSGLSIEDTGFFVGAAIGAYCPEHLDKI